MKLMKCFINMHYIS